MTNTRNARRSIVSMRIALFVGATAMALLTACGPGIGLRTKFHEATFEIGKTTKAEVIGYLGLPQRLGKDPLGRTHLLYDGSTRLIGLVAPVAIGPIITVAPLAIGPVGSSSNESMTRSGAEYVFDENDKLIAAFLPEK